MNKILFYFKQLFPLTYKSKYKVDGNMKLTIWKMWFKKCYKIRTFDLP